MNTITIDYTGTETAADDVICFMAQENWLKNCYVTRVHTNFPHENAVK